VVNGNGLKQDIAVHLKSVLILSLDLLESKQKQGKSSKIKPNTPDIIRNKHLDKLWQNMKNSALYDLNHQNGLVIINRHGFFASAPA